MCKNHEASAITAAPEDEFRAYLCGMSHAAAVMLQEGRLAAAKRVRLQMIALRSQRASSQKGSRS